MARCVSLHHTPGLKEAAAVAFHDESVLALLQDEHRAILAYDDVRGVAVTTFRGAPQLEVVLAGPQSRCLRQLRINNSGGKNIYFLGAALVPPARPDVLALELIDDFGVCTDRALLAEKSECDRPELFSNNIVTMPAHVEVGAVACYLPPSSDYYLSMSCSLSCRPEGPSTRQFLIALAFFDAQEDAASAIVSSVAPNCFHLFIGLRVDAVVGIQHAPLLQDLRASAAPFFPEYLKTLFETPPQQFYWAEVDQNDCSLASFYNRPQAPACCRDVWNAPDVSCNGGDNETLCNDGFPPWIGARHICGLLATLDAEEQAMHADISSYDMFVATLTAIMKLTTSERKKLGFHEHSRIPNCDLLYKITVPGLHEGKPQVFRGDAVYVRPESAHLVEFRCCALFVMHSDLVLQVPCNAVHVLETSKRAHIRFSIDRARLDAMRGAGRHLLDNRDQAGQASPILDVFNTFVPTPPPPGLNSRGEWFGELNSEQKHAVESLLHMPPKSPPVLLLGPPGTGKSWAVAEAICQILRENEFRDGSVRRVLLCAPTNIACDLLVDTIHQRRRIGQQDGSIFRFNEPSRPVQQLFSRNAVLLYSSIDGPTGCFKFPSTEQIRQAQVVVCTLRAAWSLRMLGVNNVVSFDYVIIDEAGQALELEAYAALACASADTRLFLAGDPKQLGPLCHAAHHGSSSMGLLRVSLLERLSEHHPRWQNGSPWSIHLRKNYRSHPRILELLSSVRYEGRLLPCADPNVTHKFEGHKVLPAKRFPIVFIGVRGQQQMDMRSENQHCLSRPDSSHSYHNPEEALAILELVRELFEAESGSPCVQQDDIGIVCAFRRQVQKVRGLLRREGYDAIRVGTVEDYQGQQERILVVSTTISDQRHAASLLELEPAEQPRTSESKSDIAVALERCIRERIQREEALNGGNAAVQRQRLTGNLIGNVRRFTVALSRAQCLLIVIGSPEVLQTQPHWRRFLTYAATHGGLRGEPPGASVLAAATAGQAPHHSSATAEEANNKMASANASSAGEANISGISALAEEPSAAEAAAAVDEENRTASAASSWLANSTAEKQEAETNRRLEAYAAEVSLLAAEVRQLSASEAAIRELAAELERQRKDAQDDLTCVICQERRRNVVFMPCGHLISCSSCFQLMSRSSCPYCRATIADGLPVYI